MSLQLSAVQRRVLGVLMEKSLAQPEYYPMTLNAITTACNQKSSRDPVMSLEDGQVGKALWDLQQRGLAAQAEPDRNARANRFRHTVEEKLGWNARERALMTELLLRGPQTAGELRTHASRMMSLDNVAYIAEMLTEFSRRDPPIVRELSRGPGQSASRYAHTMYEAGESPPAVGPMVMSSVPPASAPQETAERSPSLEKRVTELEKAVAELRAHIAAMPVQKSL